MLGEVTLALLEGFWITFKLFALTLVFALPLGLVICFAAASRFKVLSAVMNFIIWIIRGTPLLLQLLIVYYGPGILLGSNIWGGGDAGRFTAALVSFVINYACYFAEIYRGGIQSIPRGQYEAAKVLGYTKMQTFFRIVLPQVIKRIIPAMGNEVITLVKDTALVSVLGIAELFRTAQTTSSRLFSTMPIFIAGVFYFIMNWVVSSGFVVIEKKLDYYK